MTWGYVDDYDEVCPYEGSTSPDVVYFYTPPVDMALIIDLCSSSYDTKVYAYCPCPPGILVEGEPLCIDGYVDHYNGGCNSTPRVFQPLEAVEGGCADLCGLSGTFRLYGQSYRDTDWFECEGTGQTVTISCRAWFPLQIIFIRNPDCGNIQYNLTTSCFCDPATLSHFMASGAPFWVWIGPCVFRNVDCQAEYTLSVCGIQGVPPVPVEATTRGAIRTAYRPRRR